MTLVRILAGVISAEINGLQGQKVVFFPCRNINEWGTLHKAIKNCKAGGGVLLYRWNSDLFPQNDLHGFRYVGVTGIKEEDLKLSALVLYSDIENSGEFSCSNEMLNQLQSNIVWSAKSNFVDIPTDCPQRDERMGWTGDIALFAPTAVYNFDMTRFLKKWLFDVKAEQTFGGGNSGNGSSGQSSWSVGDYDSHGCGSLGDACILVPWAIYQKDGDMELLKQMYPVMKRYMKACEFWAGLFSAGKSRRIWKLLHHYGDWCAPGINMWGWM